MSYQDLVQYIDRHGRITYINKLGYENSLFGYIRKVNDDHVVWEDNELPYKCKIRNVQTFTVFNLPINKYLK
jgi:hypothetical protein